MKATDNNSETRLRHLIQTGAPSAPVSPWFTQKVLNRLPDKQKRIAARIETWTCAIAAVVTAVFGIKYVMTTMSAPVITVGQILIYLTYISIFGALIANMAIPAITSRAWRNL